MALMTGEQYIESIRKMNMEIYMFWREGRESGRQSDSSSVIKFCKNDI